MVSEQFDPAMGTRSSSARWDDLDQQSKQSILEINRSISVGLKQMLRDLRAVISEVNSRNKKMEFVKDNGEDENYGEEDVEDKQLQRETRGDRAIDHHPDPYSGPIPNLDPYPNPNPSSDPYLDPDPSLDPYPNSYSDPKPETTLNSSSDRIRILGLNLKPKFDSIMSRDWDWNPKSQLKIDVYLNLSPDLDSKFNPKLDPYVHSGKATAVYLPNSSSSLQSLASFPWLILWSSEFPITFFAHPSLETFQSSNEKRGLSTKAFSETLIGPKPKRVSLDWPNSTIDLFGFIKFIKSTRLTTPLGKSTKGEFEFCRLPDAELQQRKSYGCGYSFGEILIPSSHNSEQKEVTDVLALVSGKRHMEEVEDTCQYFLEKIYQLEAVLNLLVGTEYSSWFLMEVVGINEQKIREYGMTGETSIIGIIREESYGGVGVYLQGVEGVEIFLPIELGSADLSWGVQWFQVVDATGRDRKIQSFEINLSYENVLLIKNSTLGRRSVSFVPKFTQTFTFTFNPVTSPINQKVWLTDAYRKFLPLIYRYSSSKSSSSIPELKPTLMKIEIEGEPPRGSLPPPTPFDVYLISLMVEGRVAWLHCRISENKRLGVANQQKTSVFLSMIKEQNAAEFGRFTKKRSQLQKKRVLQILFSEFSPWHISMTFYKIAEKKSQNLLDFFKWVEFLKSRLGYECNVDGKKISQEVEFLLESTEGNFGTKTMRFEGLSNGWLEDGHEEPSPPPQPPPRLKVFDIKKLNGLFHYFPP